ncbi:hypothetical protein D9M71_341190 [compost metagenome]
MQVFQLAVLHLEGILPLDVGVEMAAFQVDFQLLRADLDHALERVQLRADEEHLHRVALRAQLARQLRILQPGLVAHAQEEALGALDAEHLDQLAAHARHHRRLDQQHALLVQPDLAFGAEEADLLGEVLQGRCRFRRLVLRNHSVAPLVVFVWGMRRVPPRLWRVPVAPGRPRRFMQGTGRFSFSRPPESPGKVNRDDFRHLLHGAPGD